MVTADSVTIECPCCYQPVGPGCDDPRKLCGQPIGMYHCPGCGVMQVACLPHMDCDECKGTHRVAIPRATYEEHADKLTLIAD